MVYIRKKIKPLKPSLRTKKRYLAFRILPQNSGFDAWQAKNAINDAITGFSGIIGLSKAGIVYLPDKYDTLRQQGIIKVDAKAVNDTKSGMLFACQINKKPCMFYTLGVSGMLGKCEDYLKTKNGGS